MILNYLLNECDLIFRKITLFIKILIFINICFRSYYIN